MHLQAWNLNLRTAHVRYRALKKSPIPEHCECYHIHENDCMFPSLCTSSSPIEVVSRGHRLPRPYGPSASPGCVPDPSRVSWATHNGAKESLSRHGLWFKLTRIYLQPLGDIAVMAMACDGVHVLALWIFWGMLLSVGILAAMGVGMRSNRVRSGLTRGKIGLLAPIWSGFKLLCMSWDPNSSAGGRVRMVYHLALGTSGLMVVQLILFYLASNIR